MIKLTAALCPSCGAKIEVNKELEKTICQYCGNTILIEEAVQKIELSGKIEVDGIVGTKSKINSAKQYIKLKDWVGAKEMASRVLQGEPFNSDALNIWLEAELNQFDINAFNFNVGRYFYRNGWNRIDSILNMYEKLESCENSVNEIKSNEVYKEKIDKLKSEKEKLLEDEKLCNEISNGIKEYINYDGYYREEGLNQLRNDIGLMLKDGSVLKNYMFKKVKLQDITILREKKIVAKYVDTQNVSMPYEYEGVISNKMTLEEIANVISEKVRVRPDEINEFKRIEEEAINKAKKRKQKEERKQKIKKLLKILGTIIGIGLLIWLGKSGHPIVAAILLLVGCGIIYSI